MLINELFTELDSILLSTNESLFTDIIGNVSSKIRKFILSNKENVKQHIPSILNYISKTVKNKNIKRKILLSLISILLSVNLSISEIKEVFKENKVDNLIEWNFSKNIINTSNLKINFELGEYKISEDEFNTLYYNLIKQLNEKTLSISGNIIVSISDDINKNFAIDDTPEEKSNGGRLIQKRKQSALSLIDKIKSKLKTDDIDINLDLNIVEKEDGRYIKFSNLTKIIKSSDYNGKNIDEDDSLKSINKDVIKPNNTGSGDDNITGLSRIYQFVELLKLGGINAKRFENDDIERGDEYTKWILNTRKSIKRFLTRLQSSYPEYNITFNKDAVAINPIEGATGGVSNISKQYTIKNEGIITSFDRFINENYKDGDLIYQKWDYILGKLFPDLTHEQALKFDENIGQFLHILYLIYGSSSLEFDYKFSGLKYEN